MERNDNLGGGTSGDGGSMGSSTGSQAGSQGNASGGGYGGSSTGGSMSGSGMGGGGMSGSGMSGGTADSSFSRDSSTDASGIADRAKSAASTAGEKLSDVGSQVRQRAGGLKTSLADALESGAERLRTQGAGGGQTAGMAATGGSAGTMADENRMGQATNQLAGGMQASADWLRDADLDGLKTGVERQVKEHPGRTLAVAVGLGYLLGKALRK